MMTNWGSGLLLSSLAACHLLAADPAGSVPGITERLVNSAKVSRAKLSQGEKEAGYILGEAGAAVRVPVCMDYGEVGDLMTASLSKSIASGMFRKIGFTLVWLNLRSCPPDGIRISLTGHTPATLHPGALAYATPYEGTHIRVFRDRIEAKRPALLVPHLLAHVLVHEIIHILQGYSRHSDGGVMKAHWDDADFSQMLRTELPIAQEDIDLVRLGIEKRARLAAAHANQDSLTGGPTPALVTALQAQ